MNILLEAYRYLDYIFQKTTGFKALLCDKETLKFISVAMTKIELFKNEVYIVDELSSFVNRPIDPNIDTFSCICILRPTSENINLICTELGKQHFPKYNLFFTSLISDEQIRELASHDSQALIQELQEVYIDFSALATRLFSLNICDISDFRKNASLPSISDRIVEGLYGSICALQVKPFIRYDIKSDVTKTIASKLSDLVQSNSDQFKSHQIDNALILILDRRNDPVTPLLHFSYYYPAIHDLFTIDNNIVKIGSNEYIIDERNDKYVEKLGVSHLKDAGMAISEKMDEIVNVGKEMKNTNVGTMSDKMLILLQSSAQNTYSNNHGKIFDTLAAKVKSDDIRPISQLEQMIATSNDADYQYQQLEKFINSSNCSPENALRLTLLFALHYEKSNNDLVLRALSLLESKTYWSGKEMLYAKALTSIAGYDKRGEPIFPKKSILNVFRDLIGSDDIYDMYHTPLEAIIQSIKDKKLDLDRFPYINNNTKRIQPQKVIIFYVGGATYMEHVVASRNSSKSSYQFLIGGTTVHNAESFLQYEVAPFC